MSVNPLAPWLQSDYQRLLRLKRTQHLSHALLFIGASGSGQDQLAEQLSTDLMCQQGANACGQCHSCQLMQSQSHPDFYVVDGRDDSIKVDTIRQVTRQVSQKPQVGATKVVLMQHAQSMNLNAANALLKMLEEPPQGTYFILTSSQSCELLATIRSRCFSVTVPTPSEHDNRQWLQTIYPAADLTDLFWLTNQPYDLLEIAQNGKYAFYQDFPAKLLAALRQPEQRIAFTQTIDNKNINDYISALQAICYKALRDSTLLSSWSHFDDKTALTQLLLQRLGIHKLLLLYQSLQALKQDNQRTNLNLGLQLTAEMNKWLA